MGTEFTPARKTEIELRKAIDLVSDIPVTYASTDYSEDGSITIRYNNDVECKISPEGLLLSATELEVVA